MNPIINPIWFYLINTFDGLKSFFFWTGGIGIFLLCIIAIVELCIWCDNSGFDEEEFFYFKIRLKKYRNFLILCLIFIFTGVVIPSEKTCYEMVAAQIITPDNLNTAGTVAKDIVDYVVQSAEAIIEAIKK